MKALVIAADLGAHDTSFGAKYLLTWAGLDRCATVGFRCVVDSQ
jgi:iron(II)-dependent oxidoreductase